MIELENISKHVIQGGEKIPILRSLDLRVSSGEFVSIMGPSGSGKSTLLQILGLLDEPTSGDYRLAGKNVRKLRSSQLSDLRNRQIGFVFQAFMLIPRLSVRENVEVPLLYSGMNRRERNRRIEWALEQVGMMHKSREPVVKLSGGQKQKAAIARAIANHPDLILADEPTGNLDAQSKEDVLHIFQQLNKQGKTLILVTHDPEVASIADRQLTMKNGQWVSSPAWEKAGSLG